MHGSFYYDDYPDYDPIDELPFSENRCVSDHLNNRQIVEVRGEAPTTPAVNADIPATPEHNLTAEHDPQDFDIESDNDELRNLEKRILPVSTLTKLSYIALTAFRRLSQSMKWTYRTITTYLRRNKEIGLPFIIKTFFPSIQC